VQEIKYHFSSYKNAMRLNVNNGIFYCTFPSLDQTGLVSHLFSTRIGGVSDGCCASLNFSYKMDNSKNNVDENFCRISEILGYGRNLKNFVCSQQQHHTNVKRVFESDRGSGTAVPLRYYDFDALITDVPGLILVTFHADCVPIYIVDPVHAAIGLCHSGWKGTLNMIAFKTINSMGTQFGSRAEDCICAIGPSICVDCYEVGEEIYDLFHEKYGEAIDNYPIFKKFPNGSFHLNLWEANKYVLSFAGVHEDNISTTNLCTCCNPNIFFSHRAMGTQRGLNAAFLSLRIK